MIDNLHEKEIARDDRIATLIRESAYTNPNTYSTQLANQSLNKKIDLANQSGEDRSEMNGNCLIVQSGGPRLLSIARDSASTDEVEQIVAHLERNQIRYLFCIGGNGTMFLADLIQSAASAKSYALQVVGIPKTIDNDLIHTDHCPGYESASKFFFTCLMDIAMDLGSTLTTNRVTIIETMGRNTGWLAAACGLGSMEENEYPLYIFIPEVLFEEVLRIMSDALN